jgi:hypothetical protein
MGLCSVFRPLSRLPAPMWPVPRTQGMSDFQPSPYLDYSDVVPAGDYVSFDGKSPGDTMPPPREKFEDVYQVSVL